MRSTLSHRSFTQVYTQRFCSAPSITSLTGTFDFVRFLSQCEGETTSFLIETFNFVFLIHLISSFNCQSNRVCYSLFYPRKINMVLRIHVFRDMTFFSTWGSIIQLKPLTSFIWSSALCCL